MAESFNVKEYKAYLSSVTDIASCVKVPIPHIEQNQNYIVISYSHLDFEKVYSDLADLYEAGVRFWYDKGLPAGKAWDDEVKAKIENPNCVGVIFYMSENLFKSSSIKKELAYTCNVSKKHFGVNLSGISPLQIIVNILNHNSSSIDMEHLQILSSAFPSTETYLDYNHVSHSVELLEQIRKQFGVVDDKNDTTTLEDSRNKLLALELEYEDSLISQRNDVTGILEEIIKVKQIICKSSNTEADRVSLAKSYEEFSVHYENDSKEWRECISSALNIYQSLRKKHPFKKVYTSKIKELEQILIMNSKEYNDAEEANFKERFYANGGQAKNYKQAWLEWKFEQLFGPIDT
jgi:hypothetical protein